MVNNSKSRPSKLKAIIDQLYDQFSVYSTKKLELCSACYTMQQTEYLKSVPVSQIETPMACKLLWEAKDHWVSIDIYKYFIPRILEVLSPPESEEDLFPSHLFEVLQYMGFSTWPANEKGVVLDYLEIVTPFIYQQDVADSSEWIDEVIALRALQ